MAALAQPVYVTSPQHRHRVVTAHAFFHWRVRLEAISPSPQMFESRTVPHNRVERRQASHLPRQVTTGDNEGHRSLIPSTISLRSSPSEIMECNILRVLPRSRWRAMTDCSDFSGEGAKIRA